MATIRFYIIKKKFPANIYARFSHSKNVDFYKKIDVFVDPKNWDQKSQLLKDGISNTFSSETNSNLMGFKIFIIENFNKDYSCGELIDSDWFSKKINTYFKRDIHPKEDKQLIYYCYFAQKWLDTKADKWRVSAEDYLSPRVKAQYQSHVKLVEMFEKYNMEKLRIRDVDVDIKNDFASWMTDNKYQYSTISRQIKRMNFFIDRAKESGVEVNSEAKKRIFIKKPEEIKEPYLNEDEIDLIYKYDFSYNKTLENVRDNFIIGLWTGLRVSDFLYNLSISNINEGYIDIQTKKTGTTVSIPLHWQVKRILEKRNGQLPRKISDVKFNKYIKDICFIVGIDNNIKGKLVIADKKKKTKRKEMGIYPKWKLVSSHICRRSFATNLYGKIPNQTLMAVCGWSSEGMMLHYIKKSNREHAEELRRHWETVKH